MQKYNLLLRFVFVAFLTRKNAKKGFSLCKAKNEFTTSLLEDTITK